MRHRQARRAESRGNAPRLYQNTLVFLAADRLEAACARALAIQGLSCTSVHSILKGGLDREPVTTDEPAPTAGLVHDNVRGAAYYREQV